MLPSDAESLDEANAAIELWEHYKKRTLDPGQRLAVYVMMATRADGLWAAATTGREMSRQNGKGEEIEVVELWDLVQRGARILHTVHDAVLLATETQSRMLSLVDGHADLRRLKARAWQGTGQQMIEMRNGGIIWYRTRTGGGGRGIDEVDRVVLDESQHVEAEHVSAVSPTMLASTNPQMNALGTGAIAGKSGWWWQQRRRALAGHGAGFGYVGHTAEQISMGADGRLGRGAIDVRDRSLWFAANPALWRRPELVGFLEEQLRRLGDDLFAREHLGVWDPEPSDAELAIANWADLATGASLIVSHRQWALAVSPDRRWASIGVAGRREDGRLHVEWMEHRAGTAWIVERVRDGWQAKRLPIRVHKSGPEAAFITPLRAAGVDVVEVSSAEVAQATGQFIDAAAAGTLVHLGQPSLDKSVRGAVLRLSTDGASMWSQRHSSVEITPLQAVTVAVGGVPVAVGSRSYVY